MAIFIMLNNFFHDFAVAMLFVSLIALHYIYERVVKRDNPDSFEIIFDVYNAFRKTIWVAWTWIIIGGIIRTLAYEQFEWMPAAGRGQIAALIVKHILLVSLVVWGSIIQTRLRKKMKELTSPDVQQ